MRRIFQLRQLCGLIVPRRLGLSRAEEDAIHAAEPAFTTPRMMEDEFPALGATYRKAPPQEPMVVVSGGGRLVTGQNPASGTAVGEALVAALDRRGASRSPAPGNGRTVKVLALDRIVPGRTRADAMPHVRAEAARAWELMKAGVIRENYLRADGSGAVCMLECSGVEEARSIMEAFPLSTAGVIGFDFIELRNFDVLEILFDESNEGSSSTSH